MDVADHTKRSNRFGLEANFELGWEQPSIPCFKSEETYRHSRPPQSRHNLSRLRSSSSDFLHDTRSIHTQGWKDPAPAVSRSSGLRRLQSSASWGTSPVGHVPRLNIPTHADDVLFGTLPEKSQHNLSSLFVDLTNQAITMPHGQRRRSLSKDRSPKVCSSSSQAVKRRRIEPADSSIEEIDLRDVDSESDLARVLERQRATTVKQQQLQADKPMKLARVTCVVCMEEMTNMTATHCGHLFCHTCLMEALIAGENQGSEQGKGPSKCPICRKKIKRPKESRDNGQVIPLEIKVIHRDSKRKGTSKAD